MSGAFTSTLGVGDFLSVRSAGFRPLRQVLGSSVYHVGWQRGPSVYGQGLWAGGISASALQEGAWMELETQATAWNEARTLALGRMREEARAAGALAVVGVEYRRLRYDWAADAIEITAIGTAIGSDRYELDEAEEVGLTNLSGEDFLKLFRAGIWPVGIVAGSTVVYVLAGWINQYARSLRSFGSPGQNVELPDYTQGLYEARALVLRQVRDTAREVGATGVLGLGLDYEHREHEVDRNGKAVDLILTMHAVGTGIVVLDRGERLPQLFYGLDLGA